MICGVAPVPSGAILISFAHSIPLFLFVQGRSFDLLVPLVCFGSKNNLFGRFGQSLWWFQARNVDQFPLTCLGKTKPGPKTRVCLEGGCGSALPLSLYLVVHFISLSVYLSLCPVSGFLPICLSPGTLPW